MSDVLRFEYALQEPAMAIAPVFLALPKGERNKLDVSSTFGGISLQWRAPDALGIPEQSVMLALLSIAAQQNFRLSPVSTGAIGTILLRGLGLIATNFESELVVLQVSWNKLVTASGYKSSGGKYVKIVQNGVKRLSETTIWEENGGQEYQSRLLSWVKGDKDGVIILLNRRATEALCGGQHVKISLIERHALDELPAKALHAWLSSCIRPGAARKFVVSRLQKHVWGGEATGSTLRSRQATLREALTDIGSLPCWRCNFFDRHTVEVTRSAAGTITDKGRNYCRAPGTIDDGEKSAKMHQKLT